MNRPIDILPATVLLVHPEPELRGIYTRLLRAEFLTVEACANIEELLELLHFHRPELLVISTDAFNSRAHRLLRQVRQDHSQAVLITVGATPGSGNNSLVALTAFGAVSHIDPRTSRVGAIAAAARQAVMSAKYAH